MNRTFGQWVIPVALACGLAAPALGQQSTEKTGAQQSVRPYGQGRHGYTGKWDYGGGPMGYGMGPGMMGGCHHGYGMYGHGMGRGMMQGYGMGSGMMWRSRMGFYAEHALGLSEHQRNAIEKIRRATADKNWQLLGKLRDAQENLYDLYGKTELDAAAVNRAYKHVSELRQEMFENRLSAQERIGKVLTAEQRKVWRSMRRGMGFGMMGGYEP